MKKRLKRGLACLLAVCLLAAGAGTLSTGAGAQAAYVDFKDLANGAWYANDLNQALLEGFYIGTSATTFEPKRGLTRGECLTVLGRLHERLSGQIILSAVEDPYPDVESTQFYGKYVAWAKEEKLILNEEGSSFKPREGILQNELATLLMRYRMRLLTGKLSGKVKENTPIARDIAWVTGQEELMQEAAQYGEFADVSGLMERDEGGKLSGYGALDEVVFSAKRFAPDTTVLRGESSCFFVRFYQWMAYHPDPVTPRARYAWVDTLDENGTLPTWLTFSESKGKKIQRGWGTITSREEYDRLTSEFLKDRTALEGKAPLTVDEDYFEEHQLLVLEYYYPGRSGLDMELSLMTLEGETVTLQDDPEETPAEGETPPEGGSAESGTPEGEDPAGEQEPQTEEPAQEQEPEQETPKAPAKDALGLTVTARGCAHQVDQQAGHVLMLVELPKELELTGVSSVITLLAEDEMKLGFTAEKD